MQSMRMIRTLVALSVSFALLVVLGQGEEAPPAPTEDRVGFPEGYQEDFAVLYELDRPDNQQVRVVYGNREAAAAVPGEPFPYGSILVMETHAAVVDEDEHVALDEHGRYQRDALGGIFVMRKEPGFGEAYEDARSGEWEYVAFQPDGSYLVEPRDTAGCAECHSQQVGATHDFVARAGLHFHGASGAVPDGVIQQYTFVPETIRVQQGETVTWYNDDVIEHTITGDGFDSGAIARNATFSHTFDEPGEFAFACSVHPAMTGTVIVEAAD